MLKTAKKQCFQVETQFAIILPDSVLKLCKVVYFKSVVCKILLILGFHDYFAVSLFSFHDERVNFNIIKFLP